VDFSYSDDSAALLYEPILSILEAHPDGLSEYQLMRELSEADIPFLRDGERLGDLELFRSHFFLFHVLYRLRDRLIEEGRYLLSIFCLEIKLHPYEESVDSGRSGSRKARADQPTDAELPAEEDPVRSYYLDLENMREVEEEDVRRMIDDFFRRLEAYYRVEKDLAVLGLPPEATMGEIRRKYRSLAFEHHPDRGGDADEFRRIEEAMSRIHSVYGG